MYYLSQETKNRLAEQDARNQMEIAKTACENQLEIEKAVNKERLLNSERLEFQEKKALMQEYYREVRKRNYFEIYFGNQGELEVLTKNPIVSIPQEKSANFCLESIEKLLCSDGKCGFYRLIILINSKEKEIFLDENKMGDPKYFMKKITQAGGQIYTNKKIIRENILLAFWLKLSAICEKTVIVPLNIGWIKDLDGYYKFIERGKLLWKDVLEKAK